MFCRAEEVNDNRLQLGDQLGGADADAGSDGEEREEQQEQKHQRRDNYLRSDRRQQSHVGENLRVSLCNLSTQEVRERLKTSIANTESVASVARYRGLLEVMEQLVALDCLLLSDCLGFYRGRLPERTTTTPRQDRQDRTSLRDKLLSEKGLPVYVCGPPGNRLVVLHPQDTTELSLSSSLQSLQEAWQPAAWRRTLCDRGVLALAVTNDSWTHGLIRFVLEGVLSRTDLVRNLPIRHGASPDVADRVQQVLDNQAKFRADAEASAADAVQARIQRLRDHVAQNEELISGAYGLVFMFCVSVVA